MMNNEIKETVSPENVNVLVPVAEVEKDDFVSALTPAELYNPSSTAMYCTMKGEDSKTKAKVYNAVNSPDKKLSECIGEVIALKDIVAHNVQLIDENTGEVINPLRVVLIDDKGVSYEAVSGGVANAIGRLLQIYGQPSEWEKPIKVKAIQKNTRNGNNKVTTLKIEE